MFQSSLEMHFISTQLIIIFPPPGSQLDIIAPRRALISVSDKSGIVDFCTFLSSQGVELLSTGGTAKVLRDAGLKVTTQEPQNASMGVLRLSTLESTGDSWQCVETRLTKSKWRNRA